MNKLALVFSITIVLWVVSIVTLALWGCATPEVKHAWKSFGTLVKIDSKSGNAWGRSSITFTTTTGGFTSVGSMFGGVWCVGAPVELRDDSRVIKLGGVSYPYEYGGDY